MNHPRIIISWKERATDNASRFLSSARLVRFLKLYNVAPNGIPAQANARTVRNVQYRTKGNARRFQLTAKGGKSDSKAIGYDLNVIHLRPDGEIYLLARARVSGS